MGSSDQRSPLWNFFIVIKIGDLKKIQCMKCLQFMNSTRNRMEHLQREHFHEYQLVQECLAEKKRKDLDALKNSGEVLDMKRA